MMPHSEDEYIACDPFLDIDRDVKVRGRKVKIVITRKVQHCVSLHGDHDIPPGTRARRETAFIDGTPGTYYYCIACMDRFLADPMLETIGTEARP